MSEIKLPLQKNMTRVENSLKEYTTKIATSILVIFITFLIKPLEYHILLF